MKWFNIETLGSKTFWLGTVTLAMSVMSAIPATAPIGIIGTKIFGAFTAMAVADGQTTIKKSMGTIPTADGKP